MILIIISPFLHVSLQCMFSEVDWQADQRMGRVSMSCDGIGSIRGVGLNAREHYLYRSSVDIRIQRFVRSGHIKDN